MTVAWIAAVAIIVLLFLLLAGLACFQRGPRGRSKSDCRPHGDFIEVDGARIHYLDEGSGPPLLLIHGLAGQTRVFTHSLLDKLKSQYRVVILDRPGCGYSTRPRGTSAAISAQAGIIARFVDKARPRTPAGRWSFIGRRDRAFAGLGPSRPSRRSGFAGAVDARTGRGAAAVSRARSQVSVHAPLHRLDVGHSVVDQKSRSSCSTRRLVRSPSRPITGRSAAGC